MDKKKVVKSGLWQLMNTAVIFISQLGYYAIMARIIHNAKVAFGLLALLNACMNFGNVVAEAEGGTGGCCMAGHKKRDSTASGIYDTPQHPLPFRNEVTGWTGMLKEKPMCFGTEPGRTRQGTFLRDYSLYFPAE